MRFAYAICLCDMDPACNAISFVLCAVDRECQTRVCVFFINGIAEDVANDNDDATQLFLLVHQDVNEPAALV